MRVQGVHVFYMLILFCRFSSQLPGTFYILLKFKLVFEISRIKAEHFNRFLIKELYFLTNHTESFTAYSLLNFKEIVCRILFSKEINLLLRKRTDFRILVRNILFKKLQNSTSFQIINGTFPFKFEVSRLKYLGCDRC